MSEKFGNYYMNKNLIVPENEIVKQARQEREKKEEQELTERLIQVHAQKQEEINSKLETLEILPTGNRLIVLPYPENPYKKILDANSGLFIEPSGKFINPDTGQLDEKQELMLCGKVIEVGPECKYVQVGDDVYYDYRTAYPLPFMSNGYKIFSEQSVFAAVGESLKQRLFKNVE